MLYVPQAGLELEILLPLPPKCWDHRCVPPYRYTDMMSVCLSVYLSIYLSIYLWAGDIAQVVKYLFCNNKALGSTPSTRHSAWWSIPVILVLGRWKQKTRQSRLSLAMQ